MLVPHHVECNVCGAKSISVQDRYQLTSLERQALREFMVEHQQCAAAREGFRLEDAVSTRPDGWAPPQCGPFGSEKPDPRSVPRPHGHCEYTGPYGETQIVDTISCCHCRQHFEFRTGVEKRLGFCSLCHNGTPGSGTTCGRPECEAHIPFALRLENVEAGRPMLTPAAPKATSGFGGAVLLEKSPVREADSGFAETSE